MGQVGASGGVVGQEVAFIRVADLSMSRSFEPGGGFRRSGGLLSGSSIAPGGSLTKPLWYGR